MTFNPLKHIDPFGTIPLPALLMITHSPFLFGYAKPVPVNFRALRRPKLDSAFFAAAGPGMNLALAILSAVLVHLVPLLPPDAADWVGENLNNALIINVLLAVFNLLPIPPLDGGRILVGLLPDGPSRALAALEPYGMLILIAALLILPILGAQTGLDLNFLWRRGDDPAADGGAIGRPRQDDAASDGFGGTATKEKPPAERRGVFS